MDCRRQVSLRLFCLALCIAAGSFVGGCEACDSPNGEGPSEDAGEQFDGQPAPDVDTSQISCVDDGACDDGDPCNGDEICGAEGACVDGVPLDCDDSDPCTTDACEAVDGVAKCVYTVPDGPVTVSITGAEEGASVTSAVTLEVAFEGGGVTESNVTLDGEEYAPGTPVDEEGAHTLEVTATACDGAEVSGTLSFTIDKTPPTIEAVVDPPVKASGWLTQPAVVTFVAADNLSDEIVVTEPVAVESPGESILVAGTATDAAGQVVELSLTLKADFKPPSVTLDEPSPNLDGNDQFTTSASVVTVSGTFGGDDLSGFDVGTITSSKSEVPFTFDAPGPFSVDLPLEPGVNTVVVSARDIAGGVRTASVCVIRDTELPRVFIEAPSAGSQVAADTVDVSGMAQDLVVGEVTPDDVTVEVNGVQATVHQGRFIAHDVPLVPGENTLVATVTDSIGLQNTHDVTLTGVLDGVHLELVSGQGQTGAVGSELTEPFVVRLVGADGSPITAQPVVFQVTSNDGTLASASASGISGDQRTAVVSSDAEGLASATLTLGTRAGAGLDRVSVFADGTVGSVLIHATGEAAVAGQIHLHSGDNQRGSPNVALPRPLAVRVTDGLGNPAEGVPVTFEAVDGYGALSGPSLATVLTNSKGYADVVFTPGEVVGWATQRVKASIPGSSVEFVVSVFLARDPQHTAVIGRVLDEDEQPVPGVKVRFPSQDPDPGVITDEEGRFALYGAPAGFALLEVDGAAASAGSVPGQGPRWPTLTMEVQNVAGVVNHLERPVYLLRLEEPEFVDGLFETELTLAAVPGFALRIPAGTQLTFPDGAEEGLVSVTQVHFDQAPMAPMDGRRPRLLVTIQPPGVRFDPPAPLQLPNTDALPPHRKVDMFSFDHDLETFVSIGTGTVSADATVIVSDPGVGVVKGGWHGGSPPRPNGRVVKVTANLKGSWPASGSPPSLRPGEQVALKARGQPGPDAYWEWCTTQSLALKTAQVPCPGKTLCDNQAVESAPGAVNGAEATVRVFHHAGNGSSAYDDLIVKICSASGNVLKVAYSVPFKPALDAASGGIQSFLSGIGCGPTCIPTCAPPQKACGDVCVPATALCLQPAGTACDAGKSGPLGFTLSAELESKDECCPGCPSMIANNRKLTVSGEAGFSTECVVPALGANINFGGLGKLQVGAFFDLALLGKLSLGAKENACCATSPPACYCFTGALTYALTIGASLKAVLSGGQFNLLTAAARVFTGVSWETTLACKNLGYKAKFAGLKATLTFIFLNGAVSYSLPYEYIPEQVIAQGSTVLDFGAAPAPGTGGGCQNPSSGDGPMTCYGP